MKFYIDPTNNETPLVAGSTYGGAATLLSQPKEAFQDLTLAIILTTKDGGDIPIFDIKFVNNVLDRDSAKALTNEEFWDKFTPTQKAAQLWSTSTGRIQMISDLSADGHFATLLVLSDLTYLPAGDGCDSCGFLPCRCCEDCGLYPCACDKICPICGEYPCIGCNNYPCTCCDVCHHDPCECPCEDCGQYPCICDKICPICGEYPCIGCNHYPCTCCDVCHKDPCICPCDNCGYYPCRCCDVCGEYPCVCLPDPLPGDGNYLGVIENTMWNPDRVKLLWNTSSKGDYAKYKNQGLFVPDEFAASNIAKGEALLPGDFFSFSIDQGRIRVQATEGYFFRPSGIVDPDFLNKKVWYTSDEKNLTGRLVFWQDSKTGLVWSFFEYTEALTENTTVYLFTGDAFTGAYKGWIVQNMFHTFDLFVADDYFRLGPLVGEGEGQYYEWIILQKGAVLD